MRLGSGAIHWSNVVAAGTTTVDVGALCKLVGMPWRLFDLSSLGGTQKQWRPFGEAIGVKDFFVITDERPVIVSQANSAWKGEMAWKGATGTAFQLLDHACEELQTLFTKVRLAAEEADDTTNQIYVPMPGENVLTWLRRVQAPGGDTPGLDADAIHELIQGREFFATYSNTSYQARGLVWRLTPNSPFPGSKDGQFTYAGYIQTRYGCNVSSEQPMLDASTENMISAGNEQMLIPEHCCFQLGFPVNPDLFKRMTQLASLLSMAWQDKDIVLSAYSVAKVFDQHNYNLGLSNPAYAPCDTPSSLMRLLRGTAWMPSLDPWKQGGSKKAGKSLVPPTLCFVDNTTMRQLLGDCQARFTACVLDAKFAEGVGTQCRITPELLLGQLKQWAGVLNFTTSTDHMERVYTYLVECGSTIGRGERLLWLPRPTRHWIIDSQRDRSADHQAGDFFVPVATALRDPSRVVDRFYPHRSGHQARVLSEHYSRRALDAVFATFTGVDPGSLRYFTLLDSTVLYSTRFL
jgi:hypothetical protein